MLRHDLLCGQQTRRAARSASWLVSVFVSAAAGCTTYERSASDVELAVTAWQRQQIQVSSLVAEASTTQPAARTPANSVVEMTPALTAPAIVGDERLSAYIREALERNPSVRAAMANVEAKLEKIPQVTSLPDPMVRNLLHPESIADGNADKYYTLAVEQMLPWPAKLAGAGAAAAAEVRMALADLEGARLSLIADVERAYLMLYLMDRFLELTDANQRLLAELERVVLAQYEVGRVPQQDVLRIQTSRAKLRDDEQHYQNQRISAAAALNQLCDAAPERPQPATESIDPAAAPLDVEALLRLAEDHNPFLARLMEQIHRDQEQVRLADLNYLPDLTLGVEWDYMKKRKAVQPPPDPETGMAPESMTDRKGDDWAVMLQMNVPIWFPRIEAARREARQNLLRSGHELRAEQNMLSFRIYDAWSRFEAQRRTIAVLRETLIPQARQTYEVTLAAYQAGTTSFIDVIEAWRNRLDFELMLHRETVDLEIAFSELQREVGLQLVRTAQAPTAPTDEE